MMATESPFFDAPADQAFGDVDDFLTEFACGEGVPTAVFALVFHHQAFRIAACTLVEEVEQVDVVVDRCFQRVGVFLDHRGRVHALICMFSHIHIATSRRIQISLTVQLRRGWPTPPSYQSCASIRHGQAPAYAEPARGWMRPAGIATLRRPDPGRSRSTGPRRRPASAARVPGSAPVPRPRRG